MWLANGAISAKASRLYRACILHAVAVTLIVAPHSPDNEQVITILGDNVNFNCSTYQPSEEITMVKWSRLLRTTAQDIASFSAQHKLFKFLKDDRLTISSSDGTCLQIQSVSLSDEGNYTCELSGLRGVFQDHFSLSVLVPPVVMLNISFLPNGQKKVQCMALKGKPAAIIAWNKNIAGNSTPISIDNNEWTVSVGIQLITNVTFNKEEPICLINHPAFNKMQNYTVSLGLDTVDNTSLMSLQLNYTLITCMSAIVVGLVLLMIWTIKRKTAAPARIINSTQLINLPVQRSGRKEHRVVKDTIYQNIYLKRSQHSA
ncbi:cell surface glycoprotein CD200 receptor 1-like isoform X2 [Narcine bancroftii]|uniref:cell surface glycoprotein CD200 receptor 1-like isoform X2 n=1 Tax=Narcine bancroftii TaxID=1343680 RepID=UPI003831A2FF